MVLKKLKFNLLKLNTFIHLTVGICVICKIRELKFSLQTTFQVYNIIYSIESRKKSVV